MRRKSMIAWCRTSAPRRTSDGRSNSSESTPFLNQLTSPPDEKARPAPVTISARNGARSASQAAASTSSPISSGLIAFSESGRLSVSVPISPSTSRSRVASSGGAVSVIGPPRRGGRARSLTFAMVPEVKPDISEQRRKLPDQPGVYLFSDADGKVMYVGKATSIRKRVGGHFSGKTSRGSFGFVDQIASIDFLVTETEAEALIAEQQFIKRHRPRFNIRLRDDKSYPYIGISLDEEFPRVYFTRERHRSSRIYFGPYSSAKRVRETLDLLGRLFQYRTCEGPEPGRRSGVPCLDYYTKRCAAPCVGYVDREEYRRGIDAIVDFLSGRYRDVERDLERKMAEAAEAEEFERAAVYRDRLEAVRSLMERRSVAGEQLDSADLVAVAIEGVEANAQVFQVRDGALAERHSFYLANESEG